MWNLQIGGVHVGLNSGGTRRLGERHFINLALYGHIILGQCQPQGDEIIWQAVTFRWRTCTAAWHTLAMLFLPSHPIFP